MIPIGIQNLTVNTIYIKELQVKLLGSSTRFLDSYDFITLAESRSLIDEITAGNVVLVRDNVQLSQADSLSYLADPSESSVLRYRALNFVQDDTVTTILFKDAISGSVLSSEPINAIQAVAYGTSIRIQKSGGDVIVVDALDMASTYIDGVLVTPPLANAVIQLNALFVNAGSVGNPPTITGGAARTINLTYSTTLNLAITGTDIVALTLDLSTVGTVPVGHLAIPVGNNTLLIGGSLLPVGSYTFFITAINYFGTFTQTVTLVVAIPPFSNTMSFNPANAAAYFRDDVAGMENNNPFYRASGPTSTAWTVFGWTKLDTTGNKPLVGFGDIFTVGKGALMLYTRIFNASWKDFKLLYGNNSGNVQGQTYFAMATGTWFSWAVVYDGTATTSAAPFDLWINGVNVGFNSTSGSWSGSIEYLGTNNSRLTVAEMPFFSTTNTGGYWDDIAFWDSDQSANISTFHNGGTPIDLGTYNPFSYYRFGDDPLDISAYPTLHNQGTTGNNLTAYNGTVADYVSDTPP